MQKQLILKLRGSLHVTTPSSQTGRFSSSYLAKKIGNLLNFNDPSILTCSQTLRYWKYVCQKRVSYTRTRRSLFHAGGNIHPRRSLQSWHFAEMNDSQLGTRWTPVNVMGPIVFSCDLPYLYQWLGDAGTSLFSLASPSRVCS